jgi:hypothetical protein
MKFRLSGEAYFEADGIDDAFAKLAHHFEALAKGEDSSLFEPETDLRIEKEGKEELKADIQELLELFSGQESGSGE